jgi:pimeloyl-ACP methyl ester carboxylesterase
MVLKTIQILFRSLLIPVLFIIFCLTIFNMQRSLREKKSVTELSPKTGRYITVKNTKLFIEEKGDKKNPPVVFLSSLISSSILWKDTSEFLSKNGFYVITVDLPPFGYSERTNNFKNESQEEKLRELFTILELDSISLISHSLFSKEVFYTAYSNSNKIKSIILINPVLNLDFKKNNILFFLNKFLEKESIRKILVSSFFTNPLFTKFLLKIIIHNKESLTQEFILGIQRPLYIENTTDSFGKWIFDSINKEDNSLKELNEMQKSNSSIKNLILVGEYDLEISKISSEQISKELNHSKLSIIPNTRHLPQIENPKELNSILLDFLKSLYN